MSPIRINDVSYGGVVFERLSIQQCRKLHNASLEILARTGVSLYLQEAVDMLKNAGAHVDDGNRVRIPAGLVERAFSTVPKRVTLHDRVGNPAIFAEDYRCYYGPGSDCPNIVDHRTGERRSAVLKDVVEGMLVCEALPHIDFVMSMFLPSDVDPLVSDRHQIKVMLSMCTKPIVVVTNDLQGAIDAVEMAEIVAGGAGALVSRPSIALYINVTTGLRHNKEALQKLLFMAEKGLPALYIPVSQGGTSAPITQPGGVAVMYAGVLAGLVLSQLKREGAPFIVPGWGGAPLDMRTLVNPYGVPNRGGIALGLAHHYGLPSFGMAGCSDSKVVDQQAAAEAALMLMNETLGGANLIHDLGYLESGMSGSLAQLVICDEIVSWIQHCLAPVRIDDETVPLDLIDEKGPDGLYIDCEHTVNHMREQWYPTLFERGNYSQWIEAGGRTLGERAASKVTDILAQSEDTRLPADIEEALEAALRRAGKQARAR